MRSAMKYAAIGALAMGIIALVHVSWDSYKFAQSGRTPVDDAILVFASITILGVVVGGALGAVVGLAVGLFRKGRNVVDAI